MPAPRINPRIMSEAVRQRLFQQIGAPSGGDMAISSEGRDLHGADGPHVKKERMSRKKKTLTPDMADDLVKSVKVSDDGNQIMILLAIDPSSMPTAQQKGAFVGKDGKVHFFTKSKVSKAGKALAKALSPYAKITARWGKVPIQLTYDSYFGYPTGTPKKDRHKIGPHLERPDGDNLLKLPADILTEVGFWGDDAWIDNYIIRKRRTTGPACTKITIENLQPKFDALYRATEEYESPSLFNQGDKPRPIPSETNPIEDISKASPDNTPHN